MKIHIAAMTTMGALALLLAAPASADFDRAGYLRCMVSSAMSIGGLPINSSTAAKIGAEAYEALGAQPPTKDVRQQEAVTIAKEHGLSDSLATLIVQCAQDPHP
jgi:hypothetical protein